MVEEDPGEDGLLARGGCDRGHGQNADRERKAERYGLIVKITAVLPDAPDAVERDLQRQKDSGRGDEQHDDRKELRAFVRVGEQLHVAHDEVLPDGEKILHHVADDLLHGARVEDVAADREQQDDEGKEREDGIGRDAEGVGVDLGACHVACKCNDFSAKAVLVTTGWTSSIGLGGSSASLELGSSV